jgi:hypothetical protein
MTWVCCRSCISLIVFELTKIGAERRWYVRVRAWTRWEKIHTRRLLHVVNETVVMRAVTSLPEVQRAVVEVTWRSALRGCSIAGRCIRYLRSALNVRSRDLSIHFWMPRQVYTKTKAWSAIKAVILAELRAGQNEGAKMLKLPDACS